MEGREGKDRTRRETVETVETVDSPQTRVRGVQELLGQDLSRLAEVLPEETRHHLKRAGSEAMLALYHLWRSVDSARGSAQTPKVRKRIDVE